MSAGPKEVASVKAARDEWNRTLARRGHTMRWQLAPNARKRGHGYGIHGRCSRCGAEMTVSWCATTGGVRDARKVTCSGPGTAVLTDIETAHVHQRMNAAAARSPAPTAAPTEPALSGKDTPMNQQQDHNLAAQQAEGLRAVADMIEQHPELAQPMAFPLRHLSGHIVNIDDDPRGHLLALRDAAAEAGSDVEVRNDPDQCVVTARFGPIEVSLSANADLMAGQEPPRIRYLPIDPTSEEC